MSSNIERKSFLFSVRVVKLSRYLQEEKKEYILSKQLIRAGTSIGANIKELEKILTSIIKTSRNTTNKSL